MLYRHLNCYTDKTKWWDRLKMVFYSVGQLRPFSWREVACNAMHLKISPWWPWVLETGDSFDQLQDCFREKDTMHRLDTLGKVKREDLACGDSIMVNYAASIRPNSCFVSRCNIYFWEFSFAHCWELLVVGSRFNLSHLHVAVGRSCELWYSNGCL